jgi:hypothetical protein
MYEHAIPANPQRSWEQSYPGTADQIRHVRSSLRQFLGVCPVADDAVCLLSELSANAVLFFLLNSCVAIAAIGEQVDLRPVLSDYLFLAADCCGTCETGQPPRSAGQLRHGCHRTRRLRKEVLHSDSGKIGGTFAVRAQHLVNGYVRGEVEDQGSDWHGELAAAATRPHGLYLLRNLASACGVERIRRVHLVWFRLDYPH